MYLCKVPSKERGKINYHIPMALVYIGHSIFFLKKGNFAIFSLSTSQDFLVAILFASFLLGFSRARSSHGIASYIARSSISSGSRNMKSATLLATPKTLGWKEAFSKLYN